MIQMSKLGLMQRFFGFLDKSKKPKILGVYLLLFSSQCLLAQASVFGRVTDQEGSPQEGVEILLTAVDAPTLLHQELIFSDAKGEFKLENLTAGQARLFTRHPEFISQELLVELRTDRPA